MTQGDTNWGGVGGGGAGGAAPLPRQPRPKKRRIWPWLLLLLGLAGGILAAVYFFAGGSSADPLKHVPPGSNIALRADGVKLATFKPVRTHLWPIVFASAIDSDKPESKRLDRIKEETGVSLPTDLREVVVVSTDPTSWLLIAGGNLDEGRFVKGLHTVLKEEGNSGWSLKEGLLVHSLGACIGQAEDGTLLFGTNQQLVKAALPVSKKDPKLPLPVKGALSFALNDSAYKNTVGALPVTLPGLDPISKIKLLQGHVTLDNDPRVQLRATPKDGVAAASLSTELTSSISKLKLAMLLMPGDLGGAKSALGSAEVSVDGSEVKVDMRWPYKPIDDAVRQLAEAIKTGQSLTGQ